MSASTGDNEQVELSGEQFLKLQRALMRAFSTQVLLERLLRTGLDRRLWELVESGSLEDVTFALISRAEREGWLEDLVQAARQSNPGNVLLRDVAVELLSSPGAALLPGVTNVSDMPAPSTVVATAPPRNASPLVHYCILTVREDEYQAVLNRISGYEVTAGKRHPNRFYALGRLNNERGVRTVAVARCTFQGNLEALQVTHDAIEDLNPKLAFVCGIAGGIPSEEFCLGDVVLGTQIHDFTVGAAKVGGQREYSLRGGPPDPLVAGLLGVLPAIPLEDWSAHEALGVDRPSELGTARAGVDAEWRQKIEQALEAAALRKAPVRVSGPIGSSDTMVQDPQVLLPLLDALRHLHAVEMESAGISHALARERIPFLPVRAISDVVGLKRLGAWTPYACATAASFLVALLRNPEVDRLLEPFIS